MNIQQPAPRFELPDTGGSVPEAVSQARQGSAT
jgi:hypothetical protein